MTLTPPFIITPRLLPGLKIGAAFISIEHAKRQDCPNGRQRYQYHIDLGRRSHSSDELSTGRRHSPAALQAAMGDLLAFLTSSEEFPPWVQFWAANNMDEIDLLREEIENGKELLSE